MDLTRLGVTCTQARLEQFESPSYGGDLITTLSALFASEPQETQRVEWPATWWQHFKQQFFPAWLLARFPLRLQCREFSVKTLYPFLKTKLPLKLCGPRVLVMVNDVSAGVFMGERDGMVPSAYYDEISKSQAAQSFHALYADAKTCPVCRRAWFEP